jgi:hypothetical protein
MTERVPASTSSNDVLYDSPRTRLGWKAVVSLATGFVLAWFMSFLRWFSREGALGAITAPMAALGAAVSLVMLAVALTSRVARRVEVTADRAWLLVHRDPGVTERIALVDLVDARGERHSGGWSRDPAEDLLLTERDGVTRRYVLPDDADTPGIVRDLLAHLGDPRAHPG